MEITTFKNPSEIIQSLEYNVYKGVSRSKTDNQKKIEDCIAMTDKITEQKSSAYRKEAMFMVACAVGIIAFAMLGVIIDQKSRSFQADFQPELTDLKSRVRPWLESEAYRIETIESDLKFYNLASAFVNNAPASISKLGEAYSCFLRTFDNKLSHEYKKKEMRWSQLQQDLNNSPIQSLLGDVKDMGRRKQQARTAVG